MAATLPSMRLFELAIALCLAASAHAQDAAPARSVPEMVATEHSVTIDGKTIQYQAWAGPLTLAEESGEPRAHVFHASYIARTDVDKSKRPITFAFNGGPGSSSVWLHLGAFGPKRVDLGDEGTDLSTFDLTLFQSNEAFTPRIYDKSGSRIGEFRTMNSKSTLWFDSELSNSR